MKDRCFDTLYVNGTIYTLAEPLERSGDDANALKVEAVGVRDGAIVYAGSRAGAECGIGPNTTLFDLDGRTMLPGFIDGHGHFPDQGEFDLYRVDLRSRPLGSVRNFEDIVAALKDYADGVPEGTWILGYGYDHNKLEEGRHPDRHVLDRASDRHPIAILHACDNMTVANSLALERSGILKGSERGTAHGVELEPDGNPTGLLMARPVQAFLEPEQDIDVMRVMDYASDLYAAHGVTTAENAGLVSRLDDFMRAAREGTLRVRVIFNPPARLFTIKDRDGVYRNVDSGIASRTELGWSHPEDIDRASPPSGLRQGADITNLKRRPGEPPLPPNRILHGRWKMQYDGSPQGRTSYNKRPGQYRPTSDLAPDDADRNGEHPYYSGKSLLNMTRENMERWIAFYHRHGQSLEVHGNGDKACEHIVAAFEKAVAAPEAAHVVDTRHGIIHGQFLERQHIERQQGLYLYAEEGMPAHIIDRYGGPDCLEGVYRDGGVDKELLAALAHGGKMAAQHFTNTYFINHVYFWGKSHRDVYFGPGRAHQLSPLGWSAYYGQRFALHNDTPVTPMEPLRSLQSAVTRVSCEGEPIYGKGNAIDAEASYPVQDPQLVPEVPPRVYWEYDQRVNLLRALRGVTIDAAYEKHLDHLIGSIEVGKLADLVVLREDPFTVDPMKLSEIGIAATVVGDSLVYDGRDRP